MAASCALSYCHPFLFTDLTAGRNSAISSLSSIPQRMYQVALSLCSRRLAGVRGSPVHLPILCLRDSEAAVVTGKSWTTSVLNSKTPVLVEFYTSWCGPCQMVHRVIDEIAREYEGKLTCLTLKADDELEITEKYEVKAVPIVLLFKNGEKREVVVGTMPKEFYMAAIERVLAS